MFALALREYFSLPLWVGGGPVRARWGGARLRGCMDPRIWCCFFERQLLGWVRWLWGSLNLRASSPLPSGSRLPPSPKGDGSFRAPALQSLGWWGCFACFCFLILVVVQKNPTSFEVGFLILDFSIYILSFTWVIVAAITW